MNYIAIISEKGEVLCNLGREFAGGMESQMLMQTILDAWDVQLERIASERSRRVEAEQELARELERSARLGRSLQEARDMVQVLETVRGEA